MTMSQRPRSRLTQKGKAKQDASDPQETRAAVIDIGSNSVRLVIYELFGAAATPVYNEKILAGLGRSLKTKGTLYAPGAAQTFKALKRFKHLCEAQRLETICVVATAAMREASDGPAFMARVKDEIGFEIECLSGKQEAQMAAYGVISSEARAHGVVADLGGASLELIRVKDKQGFEGKTYPVGPFVMMPPNLRETGFDAPRLRQKIKTGLSDISEFHATGQSLYLVGGAWRNLVSIYNQRKGYPLRILHNYIMRPNEALELAHWASGEAAQDLLRWPGLSSRRAETLPYSGLVLEQLIKQLNPDSVVISSSGVREGRLYQSLPDAFKSRDALFDACRHFAHGSAQAADYGDPLYVWLAGAAAHFPACFPPAEEIRLRRAACYLVGIGKGLDPDHRADLVFRDVLYAPLSGLTHKERAYLALMLYSSYTAKTTTPNDAALRYHLLGREKDAARLYGTAMRVATVISGRTVGILDHFKLSVEGQTLRLTVDEAAHALLNRRGELRFKKLAAMAGLTPISNWQEAQPEADNEA